MASDTYSIASSTVATLLGPVAVAATGASAGVNIRDFSRDFMVVLTAIKTAGTNPTLAVKLQHAPDADLIGTVAYTGTGNGTITQIEAGPDTIAEDITVTFSNATTAAVAGSVTGAIGTATVGTAFTSAYINFMLTAGSTAWVNTDAFTVPVTARTYADITGGAFTGLTTTGSVQKKVFNRQKIHPFIRTHSTIGGTNSPSYLTTVALIGVK